MPCRHLRPSSGQSEAGQSRCVWQIGQYLVMLALMTNRAPHCHSVRQVGKTITTMTGEHFMFRDCFSATVKERIMIVNCHVAYCHQ